MRILCCHLKADHCLNRITLSYIPFPVSSAVAVAVATDSAVDVIECYTHACTIISYKDLVLNSVANFFFVFFCVFFSQLSSK